MRTMAIKFAAMIWGTSSGVGVDDEVLALCCKSAQTQTHDTNNIDQVSTHSIALSHTTLVPA